MPWEEKINSYGDVIEKGRYLDGKLNGEGVRWRNGKWYKSPHFYDGEIHGLFCTYCNIDSLPDFYGVMKDGKTYELLEFHPMLCEEYKYMQLAKMNVVSIVEYLYR